MASTYTPIATTTLSSASSIITFSSIPQTYTDLKVVFSGKASSSASSFGMYFNNDNTLNYCGNMAAAVSSTVSTTNYSTGTSNGYYIYATNWTNLSTTKPSMTIFDIFAYTGNKKKSCLVQSALDNNGSGSIEIGSGMWLSTSAINRIDLSTGFFFDAGTKVTIYGIKAA